MTEPTLYPESGFRRLRLDLSYDGTNFSGWAVQPDRRTVQQVIEDAISTVAQAKAETIVAGRTDAGVHATGQVIHVDVPEILELSDLAYKLNRILDEDIRINQISIAPPAFHARFSALRRYYEYRILLLGTHNYAAFCKFREGATTIRTLETFSWRRDGNGYLIGDVIADAFCYSMVRNLVGAIVCVADGRKDLSWITTLLEDKERVSDSLVFPARGLTLYQVDYPNDAELLERAAKTIARREEEPN